MVKSNSNPGLIGYSIHLQDMEGWAGVQGGGIKGGEGKVQGGEGY